MGPKISSWLSLFAELAVSSFIGEFIQAERTPRPAEAYRTPKIASNPHCMNSISRPAMEYLNLLQVLVLQNSFEWAGQV